MSISLFSYVIDHLPGRSWVYQIASAWVLRRTSWWSLYRPIPGRAYLYSPCSEVSLLSAFVQQRFTALRARNYHSGTRQIRLHVLAHNMMIKRYGHALYGARLAQAIHDRLNSGLPGLPLDALSHPLSQIPSGPVEGGADRIEEAG